MKNTFEENRGDIEIFYQNALSHFKSHKCGAAPYKSWEDLFETIKSFEPKNVLEVGTGFGLTSFIINAASPESEITTFELEKDHTELARQNLFDFKNIKIINDDAAFALLKFPKDSFDLIFFDGYAPENIYMMLFKNLLKRGGLLLTANTHKTRMTTPFYLAELQNNKNWEFVKSFDDTVVYKKLF